METTALSSTFPCSSTSSILSMTYSLAISIMLPLRARLVKEPKLSFLGLNLKLYPAEAYSMRPLDIIEMNYEKYTKTYRSFHV